MRNLLLAASAVGLMASANVSAAGQSTAYMCDASQIPACMAKANQLCDAGDKLNEEERTVADAKPVCTELSGICRDEHQDDIVAYQECVSNIFECAKQAYFERQVARTKVLVAYFEIELEKCEEDNGKPAELEEDMSLPTETPPTDTSSSNNPPSGTPPTSQGQSSRGSRRDANRLNRNNRSTRTRATSRRRN